MTLNELICRLKEINLPFAEGQFEEYAGKALPDPPYICYLYHESCEGPDDYPNMLKRTSISIELYMDRILDEALVDKFEKNVLYDQEYDKEVEYINQEDLVMVNYDIEILQK